MARVRISLNKQAVRNMARSPQMQAMLLARAERIASAAGEGMVAESHIGSTRARATVHTDTFEAILAEATDRALTNALDAGRG